MWIFPLLLGFDGRIARAAFWIGIGIALVLVCGSMLIGLEIDSALGGGSNPTLFGHLWISATLLLYFWMSLALCIKRFHDHDSSAWWCLILLVPAIGFLFFVIELGMMRGTPGNNTYGPDPLATELR
jgi:uncharacterized membrane protein YhaH (DUF805 family)